MHLLHLLCKLLRLRNIHIVELQPELLLSRSPAFTRLPLHLWQPLHAPIPPSTGHSQRQDHARGLMQRSYVLSCGGMRTEALSLGALEPDWGDSSGRKHASFWLIAVLTDTTLASSTVVTAAQQHRCTGCQQQHQEDCQRSAVVTGALQ